MTETLLAFALAELVFSLSPGPAVFLVISRSLRHGFRAGAAAGSGILSVNVVFFALSAIGLGAALVASPTLFLAVKYAGAAYLAWTAWVILRDLRSGAASALPEQATDGRNTRSGWDNSFLAGVITQASSIKNLVIFVAIIPQFIDHTQNVTGQFAALCTVSVLVEAPALLGYAFLAASAARTVGSVRVRHYLDGAAAAILIGIAASIAFSPMTV